MKKASLVIMAVFYLVAGANHFYNTEAYYKIIPPFFSGKELVNIFAGILEIIFGILLLWPQTKKIACYGIICMLIAFIPTHIYMIKVGFCIKDFCLPTWAVWARLIIFQPLLVTWAWYNRK